MMDLETTSVPDKSGLLGQKNEKAGSLTQHTDLSTTIWEGPCFHYFVY